MKKVMIYVGMSFILLMGTSCQDSNHFRKCRKAYEAYVAMTEDGYQSRYGFTSAKQAENVFRAYYNHMDRTGQMKVQRFVERYDRNRQARLERYVRMNNEVDSMLNK